MNHVSRNKGVLVRLSSDQYRRSQPHSDRPRMKRYLLLVPFVFACAKGESDRRFSRTGHRNGRCPCGNH